MVTQYVIRKSISVSVCHYEYFSLEKASNIFRRQKLAQNTILEHTVYCFVVFLVYITSTA